MSKLERESATAPPAGGWGTTSYTMPTPPPTYEQASTQHQFVSVPLGMTYTPAGGSTATPMSTPMSTAQVTVTVPERRRFYYRTVGYYTNFSDLSLIMKGFAVFIACFFLICFIGILVGIGFAIKSGVDRQRTIEEHFTGWN